MKLDRLLSRIRASLQGYASEFEQRALAAEYADACAKAAARLEQVVPLIQAGQDFPALQIAESPPPVLDLVRQLSFAEAEKWRAFCLHRALPTPQPFDERSVDLVNQLYGKKIGETHPLYREYRQAIRKRLEQQALHVLQSIRRVNPDDTNAHAEFTRLAHKLYAHHRVELAAALDQQNTARALGWMESIEADDLPAREQDDIWQRALRFRGEHLLSAAKARCLEIVEQLRLTHGGGEWRDALPLLAEWDSLRSQFTFSLPPEIESIAASMRAWAGGLLAESGHEEERQKLWRDLSVRLTELNRERRAKKKRVVLAAELAELTAEREALQSAQAVSTNGSAPPAELVRQLEQAMALVRQHLRRRRMNLAGLIGTAVAVVGVLVAIVGWSRTRQAHFQTAIAGIRSHLQDSASGALGEALKDYDAHYAGRNADPATVTLLNQARDFVKTHEAARERLDSGLAQITQAAEKASPAQLVALLANLDALEQQVAQLSADDTPRARAAAQALRVRLNQALSQDQDARLARLADIDSRAEKVVTDKLVPGTPAETAAAVISEAQNILAEAGPAATTAIPDEQAIRAKMEALSKKLAELAGAARTAQAARTQLAQARTLEDFRIPLEALAANALTTDPTVAAADALVAKKPDWADPAQHILLPDDPETWTFLMQAGEARLQPATDDTREDITFTRLVGNEVLSNSYLAEQVTYVEGKETNRAPIMLAGPPVGEPRAWDKNTELQQRARKINPDGTLETIVVHWIRFAGQNPKGDKFENVHVAPETKLVARVRQAFDPVHGSIREPLLRVLDDVHADTLSSPILKAYLEQEIFKIVQNRPRDWGFTFSPSAQKDVVALAKITGGNLLPADWLFPANPHLPEDLTAFFQRTAATRYYSEAETNLQSLLQKRAQSARFVGYVDLDQQAHLFPRAPLMATLWGLDESGTWRSLYEVRNGQASPAAENRAPARLTPLVHLEENATGGR